MLGIETKSAFVPFSQTNTIDENRMIAIMKSSISILNSFRLLEIVFPNNLRPLQYLEILKKVN